MTPIELLLTWFISFNAACLPAQYDITKLSGDTFKVVDWSCKAPVHLRVWYRWCVDGQGFWSRPFLMENTDTNEGFYMNKFGEIMWGYNPSLSDVYIPKCGV